MLPPVSLPMSKGDPQAETIAAAPPLEPPGLRSRSNGLLVRPYTSLLVSPDQVISGVLDLPSSIAPAALSRATRVASLSGMKSRRPMVPAVVTTPSVSRESLSVMGTPCRGPMSSPRARASSAARASCMARSAQRQTTALSLSLTSAMRSRCACTTSTADISLPRIALAMALVEERVISFMGASYIGGFCQPPRADSRKAATASDTSSRQGRDMTCTPMGSPSEDVPHLTTVPGQPVRL